MNFITTTVLAAFVALAVTPAQADSSRRDQGSRRGTVNINSAVIPSGFDNSEPIAVVSGLFPNSCYKWDKAEVTHVDAMTHEVRSYAQISAGYCLMVMIPFSEEVPLGRFATGHHTIRFLNSDGSQIEKQLDVE